jgi:enoyl-CoA hydratase/carnithine racemase
MAAPTRRRDGASADATGARVALTITGTVAEIALAGGPLNLVNAELLRSLGSALNDVAAAIGVRCVILHGGSARAFCAGSDIHELGKLHEDASERKILFEDMVLRRLARLPMPTIAAIDGPAIGGGFELALACDLRICRGGVRIGLSESRLGGLAGNGAVRLTRLIGPARAKELLYTGDTLTAEQALAWGAINRIAEEGTALDAARALAATIAARGPLSNRLAKTLADAAQDGALDAALSLSTAAQQQIFDSADLHEGVAAFLAKRDPVFQGR